MDTDFLVHVCLLVSHIHIYIYIYNIYIYIYIYIHTLTGALVYSHNTVIFMRYCFLPTMYICIYTLLRIIYTRIINLAHAGARF